MNNRFTKWQHALISLGILITLIFSVYLVIIQPAIKSRTDNNEQIENLSFSLSKYANVEEQIKKLKQDIASLNNSGAKNNGFMQGAVPAIVAANLQNKLKTIIESNGGNLVSTHVITNKDNDSYPAVRIKVHMQVDMTPLQAILFKLTNEKPLLFTENLLIQRRNTASKRQTKNAGLVEVRFDVIGYLNRVTT